MSQKPSTAKPRPASNAGAAGRPRPKFTPRAPASTEDRLKKLHAGLVDQINEGYLENAIKTCRKILVLDPKSLPAFKTLLFLLLQTDQYPTALASFEEYHHANSPLNPSPSDNADDFEFERAYCLYRLHRGDEALKMIERMESSSTNMSTMGYETEQGRKVGHLKGQILYRAGNYSTAEQTYNDLLTSCPSDSPESSDILDNLNSTHTHLDFQKDGFRAQLSSSSSNVDMESLERDLPALGRVAKAGMGVMGEEASGKVGESSASAAAVASGSKVGVQLQDVSVKSRTRHKLPKGVVKGKAVEQDPDRWLPLLQRRSYQAQLAQNPSSLGQNKKRRNGAGNSKPGPGKEVSGLGMQGSTSEDVKVGGNGSGGATRRKGKKGR
ncbi:hypothetical protein HD553DRAFT_334603 [Filobasidium floriforme]|uniref:uncharacterized protein n=1 Tax=Filobasidium floriforme TaxID=5210 RepID=UPI001E8D686D|nr:uncharacterized protein HD553DRAFT_334603 [Filobasidium floriforme]KAH8086869.1 hypothetical protein HD553DRAFT_334603 [Filobasidium floriforme]